ncbi:MAG TPA: repressor LexA [Candidatus Latescibacteria bacterium]|nr:repressor LexA [Candidatus Latescibacterota bacterium]
MDELTERQRQILNFLKDHIESSGYAPSVREVAARFGMSVRGAHKHLESLERKGHIRRRPERARAIEISGYSTPQMKAVPVVGTVMAGEPILAVENIEGHIPLPRSLVREDDAFFLKVKGESMIQEHIKEGDYVLIRPQGSVENGEVVAVLIEEEATLKKFYRDGDSVILRPANPEMEPIIIKEGEASVRILGKVVAVFRLLDRKASILI